MLKRLVKIAVAASVLGGSLAVAQELSVADQAAARAKVQTAVALAEIAEADKDGDALLVAAKLMSQVGPVARRGEPAGDKPALYSVQDMATAAKSFGADAAKADGVAQMSTSTEEPTYCYWYYNCDSNNNCVWQYIC